MFVKLQYKEKTAPEGQMIRGTIFKIRVLCRMLPSMTHAYERCYRCPLSVFCELSHMPLSDLDKILGSAGYPILCDLQLRILDK